MVWAPVHEYGATTAVAPLRARIVVRTRGPARRSRPAPALAWISAATAAFALALPFSPTVLAGLLSVTVAYGVATEAARRWLHAR